MKERVVKKILVAALLCFCLQTGTAQADPKPWIFGWWPEHWKDQTFQHGIDHPTQSQTLQWRGNGWRPEDWAMQRDNNALQVVDGLYRADIIRRQYISKEIPTLEVGPGFYMLGGEDKRRVASMIDFTFGITSDELYGLYQLTDWRTRKIIGTYTREGLALH